MAQQRNFTKYAFGKLVVLLLFLFSFISIVAGHGLRAVSSGGFESLSAANFGAQADLTMAKYRRIKNGMSYQQVVDILGADGKEISRSEVGQTVIITVEWKGEDYKVIYCNFTNDRVSFKSQANLE